MKKIHVMIVDDHEIVRMGLSALFDAEKDMEVVGEAADGAEALRKAKKLQPDVVVTDLLMPVMDGVELTRSLCEMTSAIPKVLILTTSTTASELRRAIDVGASGIALKTSPNSRLPGMIRAIYSGGKAIPDEVKDILNSEESIVLTDRQREVLSALARGLTNEDIGNLLNISINSVKWHLKTLFALLGVANRSEAAALAIKEKMI